jgi:hypothetical protein
MRKPIRDKNITAVRAENPKRTYHNIGCGASATLQTISVTE